MSISGVGTPSSELLDGPTPRHSLLSGRFKQSFAYLTLRSRLPGIMQQIIDHLRYYEHDLVEKFGPEVRKDVHQIIDSIERLQKELNRDRQFALFIGNEPDKNEWNAFLSELPRPKRSFFRSCWLHAECYLYRRIYSFFENSQLLNGYDYFADLKEEDLKANVRPMQTLGEVTRRLEKNCESFCQLMRLNLWSSHFDVKDKSTQATGDVLSRLVLLDHSLLVDDSMLVWNCLTRANNKGKKHIIVDYVCDNAGFELFNDFLFIEFLLDKCLATKVRLHVKAIPWYISDVTKRDVEWTIDFLMRHSHEVLSTLGRKLARLMREGRVEIAPLAYFWTGPQSYFVMLDVDLELYKLLAHGQLAIFKGDLHYRKLLGDYIWDSTEEFITCLRGFRPTNICAMRTVKCEVVCGLPEGTADSLLRLDPQWMISGNYGLIQYTDSLKCNCCLLEPESADEVNDKDDKTGPK